MGVRAACLLVASVALALLLCCKAKSGDDCYETHPNHTTPGGQVVELRHALDAAELDLLDLVADNHPLPPGWVLIVNPPMSDPGRTYFACNYVQIAWDPSPGQLTYVIDHEAGHAWTRDPCYGHPPDRCH